MNEVKGFTFYQSYYESLTDFSLNDKKDMLNAIVDFVFLDKEPILTGFKKTIWTLIKPNLQASKNKSHSKPNENQKEIKTKSRQNQKKTNDLFDKDKDKELELKEDKNKEVYLTTEQLKKYTDLDYDFKIVKLTQIELDKLTAKYTKAKVTKTIISLENWKDASKHKSHYLTLINWINREIEKEPKEQWNANKQFVGPITKREFIPYV